MTATAISRPGKRGVAVVMAERQAAVERDLRSRDETIRQMREQIGSLRRQLIAKATKKQGPLP